MSYDLEIWCAQSPETHAFRPAELWQRHGEQWLYSTPNWQLLVGPSRRLSPEDVPEEVAQVLPGVQYFVMLNLEGKRTDLATRLALSTANEIAKATDGAVIDAQDACLRTASGVLRFDLPKRPTTFDVLSLSWWFLNSPLLARPGREAFLSLLERLLPEALPKRYGRREPPEHVYADTGRSHLLEFLDASLPADRSPVFYPHRPVAGLHLDFPRSPGPHKLGLRVNRLNIEIAKEVLGRRGGKERLRVFWQDASRLIRPFYGDVRTLADRVRRGPQVGIASYVERKRTGFRPALHPVKGWWWNGIPGTLGSAAVLGHPYRGLWPAFVAAATVVDGLAFVSTPDWSVQAEASEQLGGVPEPLAQPPASVVQAGDRRAELWPFGESWL